MREDGKEQTLFTIKEAAAELGVSENAVRNAIVEGRLPSRVLYGRKLVASEDVQAYKARTQPAGYKSSGRPKGMAQ